MTHVDLGTTYLDAGIRDGVLHVRINRPAKRNSITQDMYRGLKRAAIIADRESAIDALCLTGTGDVFAVGGDMSGEAEHPDSLATELDPTEHFPFRQFEQCRKVVVAAVNGICHAGGLNLLLFSDVSIASDRATFRAPELLRGAPDPWIAARLAAYVGLAKAKYLLFSAAAFDANAAETMGLLGKVVPHADFEREVALLLEQICLTGPQSRAMVKDDMNRHLPVPDVNMFRRSIMSPEMTEGFAAFFGKRPPRWPRE